MSDPNLPPQDPTGGTPPPPPPPPPPPGQPPGQYPPQQPGAYPPPQQPGYQQPYQQPGYQPYPPPPPGGGYQPYAPGMGSAGTIDIGAAFSWTFSKLQQHLVPFLLLALPLLVLGILQFFVQNAIVDALVTDCSDARTLEELANCGSGSFFTTLVAAVIASIIFGLLVWLVQIGIYRAALKTTRGETPDFQDLLQGTNTGAYMITAIVTGLCIFVGLALCVIPGLIAAFFLALAPIDSLDKGSSVTQAFKSSADIAKRNPVPLLIAAVIFGVASYLGRLTFGILFVILLPIAALFVAHIYRQGKGEPIAP